MHTRPDERIRRTRPPAVAALAVAAPAGCGGDSPAGSGTTTSAPVTVGTSASPTMVPATPARTSASRVPTGTPPCGSADLTLSLAPTDGAAGIRYTAVQLTNMSRQICFVVDFLACPM